MNRNAGLRAVLAFGLAWVIWAGALPASARTIEVRYQATDVLPRGEPTFGLRLDDVFEGLALDFSFADVVFDVFDDDTARMHGLTRVARVGSNEPSYDSFWDLDLEFVRTDFRGNPKLEFFQLVDGELRSADHHGKATIDLSAADGSAPFRIGMQVIPAARCVPGLGNDHGGSDHEDSDSDSDSGGNGGHGGKDKEPGPCLAMEGWVFWEHGGGDSGDGELVAQLTEIDIPPDAPEPALGILILVGLGFLGLRRSLQR